MIRLAVLALLSAIALAPFAACGGDSGDEGDLVKIHHIDFEGVELTTEDVFDPPFADQYPAVVAEVNGDPIAGEALASRQVMLEMGRHNVELIDFDLLMEELLADVESTDPLEALIDDAVKDQAAERLGLLPSYEEAAQDAHEYEQYLKDASARQSPEERRRFEGLLRLSGQFEDGWSSDPQWVERFRRQMGLVRLQNDYCFDTTTQELLSLRTGHDCTAFLTQERENADIVYYVRWAD